MIAIMCVGGSKSPTPFSTSGSPSSTGEKSRRTEVTISDIDPPMTSPGHPSRWIAETALGLAYVMTPS